MCDINDWASLGLNYSTSKFACLCLFPGPRTEGLVGDFVSPSPDVVFY